MKQDFVHLRLHTEFSLQDGLLTIPKLMETTERYGMGAIAITDAGNLYATVKFYQAAYQFGIKPIIGVDLCVVREDGQLSKLTLLSQNNLGYQNLLKLVSKSFLDGQINGKPTVCVNTLKYLSKGLIALSGGLEGDIGQTLFTQDKKLIEKRILFWQNLFPDKFYLEISRIGKPKEKQYIKEIVPLAERYGLPLVATNEVCFLNRNDFEAHEARVCIQEGVTLADPSRERRYTDQQYLRTAGEMRKIFSDLPESLQNTVEIAKRCNVTFSLGKHLLPHFPVPENYTTESYLIEVSKQGLEERLSSLFQATEKLEKQKMYEDRLTRELAVINKMGFAGYFLIVADFTKWAKENEIPVGPGRGSGPGSLVAYALKITDLDPLALELIFERFLNPERVSMPDFDIDFCMEGRDRVIEYVMQRHGADRVSHIITYGTMAAKAVVRDVGRVLGLGYGFVDKIAKLIPFELGMTLEKAMKQEPLLKERYENEEEVRTLIDLARKLEGIVRNVGKHAGGIVIAPGELTEFVPLYCEPNEAAHPVTQFDKDDVETVGLVKFDFLGLKTLTIIDRALRVINHNRNENNLPALDISLIPLDDEKTFALLKECKSTAIFQLESPGMKDLIKRLQPDCFEDLIALVALFRPGPLQAGMVDDFINRKHGKAKVVYYHPDLEPILSPTYGVIVYQEQVMKIAQVLAGYTLGAADILRKAMGKKKPEEMAKQRQVFCKGAEKRGVDKALASHIFDLMEKFAGYGFNKSHSASYALIAYQTAWLKTHYPAAFMASVLSSEMDRTEKVIMLLEECEMLKLHVSPPDINDSEYFFKVIDDKNLMYGLGAIKGVGFAAIEHIITARRQGSHFLNLFDFCQRVDLRKVNRRALEALIKSGCFDRLKNHRATLLASLPLALQQAEQTLENLNSGQHDLLSLHETQKEIAYIEVNPWNEETRLGYEKETLGFYLTGHPLNCYLAELANFTTYCINQAQGEKQNVRLAGIITTVRTRQTKRGDRMGIVTLDDGTGQIDTVCFSEVFHKHRALLNEGQLIIVEGEVSIDEFNNGMRCTAKDMYTIDQARERFAKYLQIQWENTKELDLNQLTELLKTHNGECPVVIRYINDNVQAHIKLDKQWSIKPSNTLLQALNEYTANGAELKY